MDCVQDAPRSRPRLMRPIHLARLDKTRPVLVLTRGTAFRSMKSVTVASITSTIRGLQTEVPVGTRNGLEVGSVVACDAIESVSHEDLGRVVGYFYEDQ